MCFSTFTFLVLLAKQFMLMTRLYTLAVNDQEVLAVDMNVPEWLPVKPKLNRAWLRNIVRNALAHVFQPASAYLNCESSRFG